MKALRSIWTVVRRWPWQSALVVALVALSWQSVVGNGTERSLVSMQRSLATAKADLVATQEQKTAAARESAELRAKLAEAEKAKTAAEANARKLLEAQHARTKQEVAAKAAEEARQAAVRETQKREAEAQAVARANAEAKAAAEREAAAKEAAAKAAREAAAKEAASKTAREAAAKEAAAEAAAKAAATRTAADPEKAAAKRAGDGASSTVSPPKGRFVSADTKPEGCAWTADGAVTVTPECVAKQWPLSVRSAEISCTVDWVGSIPRYIMYLDVPGQRYALNGMTQSLHRELPTLMGSSVWLSDPKFSQFEGNIRISIGPLINIGAAICDGSK